MQDDSGHWGRSFQFPVEVQAFVTFGLDAERPHLMVLHASFCKVRTVENLVEEPQQLPAGRAPDHDAGAHGDEEHATMDAAHGDDHAAADHGHDDGHATAGHDDHAAASHDDHAAAGHDEYADGHESTRVFLPYKAGYTIPGLLEIGIFLGFLGGFLFFVLSMLTKAPLEPKKDPYFEESLHHHT